jgi:hypothetical protein
MFHRPCQQELIQFLQLWLTRWAPLQVIFDRAPFDAARKAAS